MFEIISTKKEKTEHNANCWNIVVRTDKGEEECTYFGNTKPKKVLAIKTETTKSGTKYKIAVIQPHTSRDKNTGKFKGGWRAK